MDMQLTNVIEDTLSPDEPVADVPRATAYLLEYSKNRYVAFPPYAGVELVEDPRVVPVPGMPNFCLGLMAWQGRQLPLLDLSRLLSGSNSVPGKAAVGHVLVVAYQSAPDRPLEYGAVNAPFLINIVGVVDSQQCDLPSDVDILARISLSCFEYEGHAVPILDGARLFERRADNPA
jgi:chemotaxis signal transduction protein